MVFVRVLLLLSIYILFPQTQTYASYFYADDVIFMYLILLQFKLCLDQS